MRTSALSSPAPAALPTGLLASLALQGLQPEAPKKRGRKEEPPTLFADDATVREALGHLPKHDRDEVGGIPAEIRRVPGTEAILAGGVIRVMAGRITSGVLGFIVYLADGIDAADRWIAGEIVAAARCLQILADDDKMYEFSAHRAPFKTAQALQTFCHGAFLQGFAFAIDALGLRSELDPEAEPSSLLDRLVTGRLMPQPAMPSQAQSFLGIALAALRVPQQMKETVPASS